MKAIFVQHITDKDDLQCKYCSLSYYDYWSNTFVCILAHPKDRDTPASGHRDDCRLELVADDYK